MENKKSELTRRDFLSTSITAMASAGLVGMTSRLAFADEKPKTSDSPGKVIQRRLGKTDLILPIVSMGVMNADNPEVVQASYELGIRHFDTAAYYQFGRNEQMVGNVIGRLGVRDKVVIATKVLAPSQRRGLDAKQTKERLMSIFEGSLQRLKMDYADILYIHETNSADDVNNPGIQEGLSLLKEQKKTRYVGLSCHSGMTDVINEVVRTGFYDVVLAAFNLTMADDLELLNAMKNAASKGVGIVAMKTQAGGQRLPRPGMLKDYSSATIATAALKWVLHNEAVTTAVPGYTNFEHMKQDFSVAADLEYTPDESKFLSERNIKLGFGFCRQCRRCLPTCPRGADIPTLMRTHMYAAQYANFHHARAILNDIPQGQGIDLCATCRECTAQCADTVEIKWRIGELKAIYT